ncbi:hypothetical protein A2U01_0057012, partial [Trifolium medium]|nr:hypothetical protein [Trifolium medium]
KKGRKEKIPSKGSTARSTAFPGSSGPSASVDIHFPLSLSTDVAQYIDEHYKFDWDSVSIKDLSLEEATTIMLTHELGGVLMGRVITHKVPALA